MGELAEFEEVECASAEEAARVLFEEALPATPVQDEAKIRLEYDGMGLSSIVSVWGSRQLVEGPEPVVREVVLRNLHRIARAPGLKAFAVVVVSAKKCAQVNAVFPTAFVPVRVWRTSEKLFACGNSLFTAD